MWLVANVETLEIVFEVDPRVKVDDVEVVLFAVDEAVDKLAVGSKLLSVKLIGDDE